MAIEHLSGSVSAPTWIPLTGSGDTTFVVPADAGAQAGALLPVSPATGLEITLVCLSPYGLVVSPFGEDTIKVADLTSGDGNSAGCILCTDAVAAIKLRAVTGGWAALQVLGFWEVQQTYALAGPIRGSVRGAYRMLLADAATMTAGGSPASAPAADARGLSFAAGADHDISFRFVMPADWQLEGDVALHLLWCKTTSAAGAVKWQARYRVAKPGAGALTAFSAWADFASTVKADGDTAERVAVVRFADLDMASTAEGTVVIWDIRREGSSGSDTYAAAAVLIAAGLQYPADVAGWRSAWAR